MLLHGDIIVHSGQHQLDTSKVACNKAKDLRDFIQSLSSQLYNLKNNLQKHMKKTTHTPPPPGHLGKIYYQNLSSLNHPKLV